MGLLLCHTFPSSCPTASPPNRAIEGETKRWRWECLVAQQHGGGGSCYKRITITDICADRNTAGKESGCRGGKVITQGFRLVQRLTKASSPAISCSSMNWVLEMCLLERNLNTFFLFPERKFISNLFPCLYR